MNNEQFRKLVQNTPARQSNDSPTDKTSFGTKKSSLLGGMTPRPGVKGSASGNNDFARQIRERHASLQPTKKFKTYAPKGSKFAAGYVDRAKARQEAQDAEDDKAQRVKALEEQVKLGQLPLETFEALRDQITGGDFASAHLVKGLDRKLLERVRRGEDVMGTGESKAEAEDETPVDVDDELDKLEEQEIETVKREKVEKKGSMAPPPVAGVKRTRDEIMAELKAQRKAAAEAKAAAAPTLDSRWKRVGEQSKPKIEIDHKGREVLITVGEDGVVKKKVRKLASDNAAEGKAAVDMPESTKEILGADFTVPEQPKQTPPDDDGVDDIFADAGTEYNPLGDQDDDDDDSDDSDDGDEVTNPVKVNKSATSSTVPTEEAEASSKPPAEPPVNVPKRNYFNEKATPEDQPKDRFQDIENIIKKAAKLGATAPNEDGEDGTGDKETQDRLAKRAKMIAQEDRDLDDMDMGFGSSRYEDEQEGGEEKRVKLSEWKGGAAGGDDGWEEDKKSRGDKPKRKPKKRKGDVNNAADIFRVIEGRKAGNK